MVSRRSVSSTVKISPPMLWGLFLLLPSCHNFFRWHWNLNSDTFKIINWRFVFYLIRLPNPYCTTEKHRASYGQLSSGYNGGCTCLHLPSVQLMVKLGQLHIFHYHWCTEGKCRWVHPPPTYVRLFFYKSIFSCRPLCVYSVGETCLYYMPDIDLFWTVTLPCN